MLKRLMITTAAMTLMVGSVAAQQTTTPPAQTPAAQDHPSTAAGSHQFITSQMTDQWLASKFRGTDVMGNGNEKIGDVTDILFDRSGRILAYVVGVGGFLGIGQKDVALAPNAFTVENDRNTVKLRLAMTRDQLKNAPEFRAASSNPAPTTGQAPRDRTAPPPAK